MEPKKPPIPGRPGLPPPPPQRGAGERDAVAPKNSPPVARRFEVVHGRRVGHGQRVGIYGTGGVGKTTLACSLFPGVREAGTVMIDVEGGGDDFAVDHIFGVQTWEDLRSCIAAQVDSKYRVVGLDSLTKVEEMATDYIVRVKSTEKGKKVDSIDGFGWGHGWDFVYDEMNALFADLDRVVAAGKHVVLIAHEVTSVVPNPVAEDFIRWEPNLYGGSKKGKSSVRNRWKSWTDHLLFLGYDIAVRDSKGVGVGTRTIYTSERPTHIASVRRRGVPDSIPFVMYDDGSTNAAVLWDALGIEHGSAPAIS